MRRAIVIGLLFALWALMPGPAARAADFVTTPRTNHGEKWRIGYLEGGPYFNYHRNLAALVRGLMELGWIEKANIPSGLADEAEADTAELWRWLSHDLKSDYLRFMPDGWYSDGWSETARPVVRQSLIERLNRLGDLDLVIAAGTWAGQDLATPEIHTPIMVFSVSDPVLSGIVKSPEDSGLPNVHAKCDPERYVRMARLFHNIFRFKRLGVTYEDTPEGRAYGGIGDLERVAAELGFRMVRCFAPMSGVSEIDAEKAVIDCQWELARKADAVIIPVHRGVTVHAMSRILAPLLAARIPTMTQHGSLEVAHGVLLGMTLGSGAFREIGLFHARVAASIFNGVPPGDLPLVFEDPRQIALNLETARIIGWAVPPALIQAADEVFRTILPDEER